ncbi:MAG: nicotinate-nucleotide adenylyltransferase [Pseudomonadales bacterium]
MKLIAIFGGTFDPVHRGHLEVANEVRRRLGCDALIFLIAGSPPLRDTPSATSEQRLEMLQLALAEHPEFEVDARELTRSGKSYTVDTLEALRGEMGYRDVALAWILGADAYAVLPQWHRWRELLDLAHLVILDRPGTHGELPFALEDVAARCSTPNAQELRSEAAGRIYHLRQPPVAVSSTQIRKLISEGRSAEHLLPSSVWAYITGHGLYGWQPGRSDS